MERKMIKNPSNSSSTEFEVIDEEDYDFQLTQKREILQDVQLEEIKHGEESYYLPTVNSNKKEKNFGLQKSQSLGYKLDDEIKDLLNSKQSIADLQEQYQQLKQSMSLPRQTDMLFEQEEQADDENSMNQSSYEFSMVQPAEDQSIIGFYNNNQQQIPTTHESPDSILYNLLINTKFKLDSKMSQSVLIQGSCQARLFSKPYYNQDQFLQEFEKLIWITYRKNFAPLLIEKNKVANLTSDAGWGCVIRCTQMLLANTLQRSLKNVSNAQILELFDDDRRNTIQNAFSIQNIVEVGLQEHQRLPGEWYGVQKMNEIFQTLNETYNFDSNLSTNILGNFKICQFQDGEIIHRQILKAGLGEDNYQLLIAKKVIQEEGEMDQNSDDQGLEESDSIQKMMEGMGIQNEAQPPKEVENHTNDQEEHLANSIDFNFTRAEMQKSMRSTIQYNESLRMKVLKRKELNDQIIAQKFKNTILILTSIRLGMDKVPSSYHQTIQELMNIKQFVGSVGGRPNLAYYLVGNMYSNQTNLNRGLIYLDPHCVQTKCKYADSPEKYHYNNARIIEMSELDPSLSFGYLIESYQDYIDLCDSLDMINQRLPEEQKILTIQNESPEQRILDKINLENKENDLVNGVIYSITSIQSDYFKDNKQ